MADATNTTSKTPGSIANVKQAVNSVLSANFDAKSQPCLLTCIKLVDNLLTKPNNPVFRTIKLSNPSIQSKIVECKGGVDVLRAMGFRDDDEDNTNCLQLSFSATITPEFLRTARQLLAQRCVQELGVDSSKIPRTPAAVPLAPATPTTATFNPYARQRFNAASAAQQNSQPYVSTTEAELEKLQRQQAALERRLAEQPLDRAWRATRPGMAPLQAVNNNNSSITTTATETGSDASLLAARAAAQQRNLTTEQPLTTRAMRTVKALQTKKVYAQCVLHICFPDGGVVLMGTFRPQDTIASVLSAIQTECCCVATVAPQMELYVTPPRRVLRGTLQDEGLVPAAKVFVRYLTAPTYGSAATLLRPELFVDSTTTTAAAASATTAFPQSHPVVQQPNASTTTTKKPKSQKKKVVSKEEALLKRMMGKK